MAGSIDEDTLWRALSLGVTGALRARLHPARPVRPPLPSSDWSTDVSPSAPVTCQVPSGRVFTFSTHRGSVTTRPAAITDHEAVGAMHTRSSLESRYNRYQSARGGPSRREWSALIRPGTGESYVSRPDTEPLRVVSVCHLLHTPTEGVGELGILVEDAWQDLGLGTALVRHVLNRSRCLGLHTVLVMTGWSNHRMRAICRTLGSRTLRVDGDILELALPAAPSATGPCTRGHGRRTR
ncbi:GNAT family N-acetyltransferase [Streptomyces fumanus]|uniref:GNAT family N-acetyltransferase n=1 Tax=Streptomyces fumanus TaxID=67302 RepID=UPI0033D41DB5